jgi:arylsulfatase A-like enzyme
VMTAVFLLTKETPGGKPLRMQWSGADTGDTSKSKLTFLSHKIQRNKTRLSVRRKKELSSLKGVSGNKNAAPGVPTRFTLKPGLDGHFILDFFALIKPEAGEKIAVIKQLNAAGEIVKEIPLETSASANSFQRFQIPLDLEKDHILELHTRRDGFGFIGRPVFYRPVKEEKRRFVFLVMADTLRWDKLGVYNPGLKTSPRIDAFAKDAVVFTQAYSTAPWTLPAHMSLFTGLFPDKHQVHYGNNTLSKQVKPLMQELNRRFMTYSFNESHFVSARFGFDRGFDIYTEMQDTKPREKTKRLFDKARRWVEMEKSGFAFFFLHTYQLHHPYYPEIKLANDYYKRTGKKGFKKNLVSIYDFIAGGRDIYRHAESREKDEIETVYEAGVFTFDFRFGEFIDFLKQQGLYEQSMIFLLSDHGEEFHDHGGWEHSHSLYNELIKIPLMVKFPANRHGGKRIDGLTSIADVLAPLFELYDIKRSAEYPLDGRSLLDTIEGKDRGERFLLSYLAPNVLRIVPQKVAVISGRLKFIYNKRRKEKDIKFFKTPPPGFPGYEMFDIIKDPGDRVNIMGQNRQFLLKFTQYIKKLKFKKGKKGFLKGMEKDLKTLGYL